MSVLVLVGTPIGNLGDLSPRAIDELGRADVIACEDTRRTRGLLSHAGVRAPKLVAIPEHSEAKQVAKLLDHLAAGDCVAVVTDAGMPAVSDPGERIVRAAIEAGYKVEVVPGPSAALAALVVSGLETQRFCFEGFIPRKGSGRRERLSAVATERRTTVLFEAPHRVLETIGDLVEVCGADRAVAIVRELTKLHEEVWRGSLGDAAAHVQENGPRGEYVLVLAGAPPPAAPDAEDVEKALLRLIADGVDKKLAVTRVAAELGVPRREVYAVGTRLSK